MPAVASREAAAARPTWGVSPMDVERIRAFHRTDPFRAFTIRLASGGQYRVEHPEHLAINAEGRAIALAGRSC
jgi:hypothetical protein